MAMEFRDCSEVELEKPLLFTAKDYATEYHTGVTTIPLTLATVFGRTIAYAFGAYARLFWIYLSRFIESIPLICIPWMWFVKWIYPLDEETLLKQAQKATDLQDYGDESFKEPLRILLKDMETEGKLNCMGRSLARTYMQVRTLMIAPCSQSVRSCVIEVVTFDADILRTPCASLACGFLPPCPAHPQWFLHFFERRYPFTFFCSAIWVVAFISWMFASGFPKLRTSQWR